MLIKQTAWKKKKPGAFHSYSSRTYTFTETACQDKITVSVCVYITHRVDRTFLKYPGGQSPNFRLSLDSQRSASAWSQNKENQWKMSSTSLDHLQYSWAPYKKISVKADRAGEEENKEMEGLHVLRDRVEAIEKVNNYIQMHLSKSRTVKPVIYVLHQTTLRYYHYTHWLTMDVACI